MPLVSLAEASEHFGVSIYTIKRRIQRGELSGRRQGGASNSPWVVDLPTAGSSHSATASAVADIPDASAGATAAEVLILRELVDTVRGQLDVLQQQLQSQRESHQAELDARRREVQELHVLLQQTQAALPAPKVAGRHWWRLWRR